jgi:predicted O-methyltransferase YrrM
MNQLDIRDFPLELEKLENKCKEIGFEMPSDRLAGSLLKTLIASKPTGKFLELGTGIGLSLAWMIAGMDQSSSIISLDNDENLIQIVQNIFHKDARVSLLGENGEQWIQDYSGGKFDLIFADTWPGKYNSLDEVLDLLKVGGIYVIDDMNEQPNWPEGHDLKAKGLIEKLEQKENFTMCKMNWSTGIILMTRIK